jgi:hypothetical protein
LQRGDAPTAHLLAESSLAHRTSPTDPWRLFMSGHYAHLNQLIIDLRKAVGP